jgi:hypothetical protein
MEPQGCGAVATLGKKREKIITTSKRLPGIS